MFVSNFDFFKSTWFSAILALDLRRVRLRRDGCFCCFKHSSSSDDHRDVKTEDDVDSPKSVNIHPGKPMAHLATVDVEISESIKDYPTLFFGWLARVLVRPLAKSFVLLLASGLLSLGVWSAVNLDTEFKAEWLVDMESSFGR